MKKIIYKTNLMLILAFIFVINGCKDESSIQNPSQAINLDFTTVDIGKLHNQYLINVYGTLKDKLNGKINNVSDLNSLKALELSSQAIINEEFSSIAYDPSSLGYTHDQYMGKIIQIAEDVDTQTYFNISSYSMDSYSYISSSAQQYLNDIFDAIDTEVDLVAIIQSIEAIEAKAKLNLTNYDLALVTGTAEIAKSSAYLWAPESQGGYDLYTKTFGESFAVEATLIKDGDSRILKKNRSSAWRNAIKGDASASSAYFMGIGIAGMISAAAVPTTGAALLLGWSISAGLGSAYAALGM